MIRNEENLVITPSAKKWYENLLTRLATEGDDYSIKEIITPERAAILLSNNPNNRNLRESNLAKITSDMKEGRFVYNGQTIIISSDGLVNDGQHRLRACVDSGVPFTVRLVVGVERETRTTLDVGANRSPGDALAMEGHQNSYSASAIARFIISWERDGTLNQRARVSGSAITDRVRGDALLQEIAGWVDAQTYRWKNMVKKSVVGSAYYLLAQVAPTQAQAFMELFRDGSMLSAKSPIFLLRERLRQEGRLTDMQRMELIVRAWNHWIKSPETDITRLQVMNTIPDIIAPRAPKKG